MISGGEQRAAVLRRAVDIRWPSLLLWAGLTALIVPTLLANARQSWSSEQGEQGPFVLAIGVWLVFRTWPAMRAAAQPSSAAVAGIAGFAAASAYVLGRVADQFLIETYALYALGLVGLYALLGWRSLSRGWFGLTYLIFALPAPYTLTWMLTSHLRLWLTEAAVAIYKALGFSIVRDGLVILVDQYELAVRDACSGMNSLIGLSAMGLAYVYLRRSPTWWYLALMILPIIAFAIFGNFARILVLIALTHYFGDAVAQGYLHESAGIVTFVIAMLGVVIIDAAAAPLLLKANRGRKP